MNPIKLSLFVMGVILLNGAVGEEHHACTIEATMDPDGEACCVLTLEDCEFRGNGAGSGGAVYNEENGTVVMKGCTFSSSYGEGSALFTSRGRAVLKDCEIKGNGGDASISCFVEGSYVQLDNYSIHDN